MEGNNFVILSADSISHSLICEVVHHFFIEARRLVYYYFRESFNITILIRIVEGFDIVFAPTTCVVYYSRF